jgi:hypothetical protein
MQATPLSSRSVRAAAALFLFTVAAACADPADVSSGGPQVGATAAPDRPETEPVTVKPGPPISVSYALRAAPTVNQPLVIELSISSATTGEPMASFAPRGELMLGKSQSPQMALKTSGGVRGEPPLSQTREVVVVPLQEGRSYLNVLIEAEHEGGPVAKAIAIPIQTGDAPPVMAPNGVEIESDGEIVNSLPARRED